MDSNFNSKEYFYFLLPIHRESIVFGSNFRSRDFDGFTSFKVHCCEYSSIVMRVRESCVNATPDSF